MKSTYEKQQFLALIRSNIEECEFHITTVNSHSQPRYAYTIGLHQVFGFELILAGGIIFLKDDLYQIFHVIFTELKRAKGTVNQNFKDDHLGAFSLAPVHPTWSKLLMLGVFDYYQINEFVAFQILPDADHHTLDIPDMSKKWDLSSEPVWQWMERQWAYAFPEAAMVATNIETLQGEAVTELTRWEEDYWEMFSYDGPDVPKEETRIVPLATMLGIDPSLLPALDLEIGKGLWRNTAGDEWNDWV